MKMGIQDLQTFLESAAVEGGSVSVDLLRLSRNIPQLNKQFPNKNKQANKYNGNKLKLVLDAECCLDRLYGGYFSDWACGGQWNRTVQFLSLFMHAVEGGNIELAVIFNGALEQQRMSDWIAEQTKIRQRINQVLKHLNQKGTPPPKVWWCPPTCLRTVLRMALRHLNTTVLCSMDDHHQEVIAYCRENGFHGLIADDAEYAAFDPPRYFSSENLKLTYKGSLETKEFMVSEMTKILKLTHEQLCVLAALLGNYLLPESDLIEVYRKAGISFSPNRPTSEQLVRSLAEFVSALPPVSQLDTLITQILGSIDDKRASALRQSIQYYLNGTADGFLKYRTATTRRPDLHSLNKKRNNVSSTSGVSSGTGSAVCVNSVTTTTNHNSVTSGISSRSDNDNDLDTSGFASETTEREQKSLEDYKLATKHITQMTPEIIIEQSSSDGSESLSLRSHSSSAEKSPRTDDKYDSTQSSEQQSPHLNGPNVNGTNAQSQTTATTGPSSTISLLVAGSSGSASTSGASSMNASPRHVGPTDKLRVSVEVMRTATERHQKGLMSPIIYHTLVSNEVRLPCVMEDEQHREFPPVHLIFRPVRQKVYAIIFNLHHLQYLANKSRAEAQAEGNDVSTIHTPEVHVKEWTWSKLNQYQKADVVKAEQLGWAVPTIQRLWFGSTVDDKRRRLRAFLTCMNSDSSFMLNPSYVPQHMLILACVLRYIMSYSDKCILRKQELDAFIAQAFAPELMNSQYLQELTLPSVSSRGVQLAALFMHGVETALLANDACGAPIPWLMSCPWLYLDGKLFHYTLIRAGHVKNLLELCENHIDRVVKVERMRKAILEGLDVQFAKPPLPPLRMPPPNCLPPVNLPSTRGPAGLARRSVPARGGQLQVAGVVVGQWGANYGFSHQIRPQMNAAATYAIGRGRGGNIPPNPNYPVGGRGYAMQQNKVNRGPTWSTNKKVVNNKKKTPVKKGNKGRGLTVQLPSGETVLGTEVVKTKETLEEVADKDATSVVSVSISDSSIFEDAINGPKQIDHKGQGDGPTATATATATATTTVTATATTTATATPATSNP